MSLTSTQSHRGLDDLPNELLVKITQQLIADIDKSKRATGTGAVKSLRTVSSVSRHVREANLPLLFRHLSFNSWDELVVDAIPLFSAGGRHAQVTPYVRSVRVPYHPDAQLVQESSTHQAVLFPFHDIINFECTKEYPPDHLLEMLKPCSRLSRVAIRCDDSADASWSDVISVPGLEVLRLFITRGAAAPASIPPSLSSNISFESITTLALYHHGRKKEVSRLMQYCIQRSQFPHLKILTVEGWESHTAALFQFIHCHPTLLEVNVLTPRPLRPESLLRLIDGTGTWVAPLTDPTFNGRLCQIEYHDLDHENPFPPNLVLPLDGAVVLFSDFAFAREPLSPSSTQWRSPVGSQQRRYRCKSLAIQRLTAFGSDDHHGTGQELDFTAVMEAFSNHFPDLEELRVSHGSQSLSRVKFGDLMDGLIEGLVGHPSESKIKKLSFHSSSLALYWDTEDIDHFQDDLSDQWVEIIDSPHPPYGVTKPGAGKYIFSLDDLIADHKHSGDWIKARLAFIFLAIRQALDLGPEAQVDQKDETLLMRVWEKRHKERVAQYVTALGDSLPRLEEFDWYVMSEENAGGLYTQPSYKAVVWHWEFERDNEGWVTSTSGTLSYIDGPGSDDPPKFYSLVGEELARALELRKTSLNRYYGQPDALAPSTTYYYARSP